MGSFITPSLSDTLSVFSFAAVTDPGTNKKAGVTGHARRVRSPGPAAQVGKPIGGSPFFFRYGCLLSAAPVVPVIVPGPRPQ
jgi:hypothetical protein